MRVEPIKPRASIVCSEPDAVQDIEPLPEAAAPQLRRLYADYLDRPGMDPAKFFEVCHLLPPRAARDSLRAIRRCSTCSM